MDINEAIKTIEDHNKWRRGYDENPPLEMTNAKNLGIAIDLIVSEFKKIKPNYCMNCGKKQ